MYEIFDHLCPFDLWPLGAHVGLKVEAKIAEQRQWDSQRPSPRQWKKKRHPLTNNSA